MAVVVVTCREYVELKDEPRPEGAHRYHVEVKAGRTGSFTYLAGRGAPRKTHYTDAWGGRTTTEPLATMPEDMRAWR